jgi:glycosyltransferase involved in cell wall biosynthesis
MLVSIVLPVFDMPAAYLCDCWASILAQRNAPDWEVVLVDDGSRAADTLDCIAEIATDPRVRHLRLPENRGVGRARNAGLSACRSEIVVVHDADDLMEPDRLALQSRLLAEHPEVAVVGGQSRTFRPDGSLAAPTRHPAVATWRTACDQADRDGRVWWFTHGTLAYRRSAVRAVGGYTSRRPGADVELGLRLLRAGYRWRNLPDVLIHIRRRPGSVSASLEEQRRAQAELIRQYCRPS